MTDVEAVPGVGPAAAKRLRDAFITTAEILSVQNPIELQERTKLGEATVRKIIRAARDTTGKFGFRSGIELEKEQAKIPRLSFGISSIDEKLMGGLEAGSIIEFYGGFSSGKTQWCHHLAVRAQLSIEKGGLEGRVLWLDSESSFKTNIIRANAIRWGLDPDVALGNINVAPMALSSQIEDTFEQIQLLLAEGEFKMLVIDSLTGLFRAEYRGIGTLATRQQTINGILNSMRRMGIATEAVFAYTNQVTTQISNYGGNAYAPAGGHVVSHASDYRFYAGKGSEGKRKLVLRDNAGVPEFTVEVHIGWGGFYKEKSEKTSMEKIIKEKLGAQLGAPEEDEESSKKKTTKKAKKGEDEQTEEQEE
ncbi:MAG: hypothetical protein AM326_05665 [Candidatus Thorarchaeota archaeon SMTZ-45]|nr:MAG: hypothetical protein AM325_07515 [Candidatus Thorarchaeota archaeon SMTZ1-45]KXH77155.1 MAG: hypothetical protein AM326_05665 [Candidatus Thorarchaeota archaeon SMTZ-45]